MIIQSMHTEGATQADGRVFVTERHLLSDGRTVEFEYLADDTINRDAVMTARATRIAAQIAARDAANGIAAEGSAPLTKYQFRQLFTYPERIAIDAFNLSFESNAQLTAEQKAAIRTNLADFAASSAVHLSNPQTMAGVQMYEALGLIAPGRAAEIING